jgi:hypothetical protein
MEAELAKNTNEQISQYQVRIDLMEKDLANALKRAERAEKELLELRKHLRESVDSDQKPPVMATPIPVPPPPPPLPPSLNGPPTTKYSTSIVNQKLQQHESTTPIKKQSATGRYTTISIQKVGKFNQKSPLFVTLFCYITLQPVGSFHDCCICNV